MINQNDQFKVQEPVPSKEDQIIEAVLGLGWEAGHRIVQRLIGAELGLHQSWLKEGIDMDLTETNQKVNLVLLARDVCQLQQAQLAMNEVMTPDQEDNSTDEDA